VGGVGRSHEEEGKEGRMLELFCEWFTGEIHMTHDDLSLS